MIIGISGKKQVGKDTVGQLIQYLTSSVVNSMTFEEYTHAQMGRYVSKWQIKKFAGLLKAFASMVLNISEGLFEYEEFKESKVLEVWSYYKAFDIVEGTAKEMRFATLIEAIDYVFRDYSEQEQLDIKQEVLDTGVYGKINSARRIELVRPSIRELFLQEIGTEVARQIHPNFWVNALMSKYLPMNTRILQHPDDSHIDYPDWIITDVRFPNEVKAIKKEEGIVIRINSNREWEKVDLPTLKEHISETALDKYLFNYVIHNNGTVEDLQQQVKEILTTEKII